MNKHTHERFSIGNGNFYAIMQGLSMKEIRASHTSQSFCSLEYMNTEENSFTKSQRIYDSSRWHTRILTVLNPGKNEESLLYSAEIDDRVFAEGDLYLRTIKNKCPIYFKLILPDYTKFIKAPDLSYEVHHINNYWIRINCGNYEEILQISLSGDCKLDINTMTFTFFPGESDIIFATGTIPAVIQRNAVRILHLLTDNKIPEPKYPFNEQKSDKIRNSLYALTTHIINNKGIVSKSNDPYVKMLPLYTVVKLFNKLGMQKTAKAVSSSALKNFLTVKDCVGLGRNNEPLFSTDIFSLVPSLLMLTSMEAPDERLIKNMVSFMVARCRIQSKALIQGMLPFEGREYYYNNFCPITDGSAISTLFYIKSTEQICNNTDNKEFNDWLHAAKSRYRTNFINGSEIFLNAPSRTENARLPKYIYGICDFCHDPEFSWLIKNSAGAYCCDNCMETHKSHSAPNSGVLKVSHLPALWSVYLDMEIFTPEEIAYSQELAIASVESLPVCDLALLLNSMTKYHHLAFNDTRKLLLSKQNSLGIWYDENGEFDTLTNALCCHAIINSENIK